MNAFHSSLRLASDVTAEKRAKHAANERARRAAKKAAKSDPLAKIEREVGPELAKEVYEAQAEAYAAAEAQEAVVEAVATAPEQRTPEQVALVAAEVAQAEAAVSPGLRRLRASQNAEALRESALAEQTKALDAEAARAAAPKTGLCMSAAQAHAEATLAYGDAPHTVKKTARGDWYYGPVEAPAAPVVKAAKAAKAPKAAKAAEAPKAAKAPKAAGGAKAPRPGTDAEVILALLSREGGCTKGELEGDLAKLRGRPIKIAMRSTSLRFGESYGLTLVEKGDRFALVARG